MDNVKKFLGISALLTGFSEVELSGTGMIDIYYETVLSNTPPETCQFFFDKVGDILKLTIANKRDAIAAQIVPTSSFGGLGQRIILLWYEGMWVTDTSRYVISSQSFIQSLMWTAAKTHPSGAKQPGFGSWSEAPL